MKVYKLNIILLFLLIHSLSILVFVYLFTFELLLESQFIGVKRMLECRALFVVLLFLWVCLSGIAVATITAAIAAITTGATITTITTCTTTIYG